MPKTKRDRMKGSIATARLDLQRALAQLQEVYETFKAPHPELLAGLEVAVTLIVQAQRIVERFYEICWGDLPENWDATKRRK